MYVGKGTDEDYAKIDVRGKIVLADIVSDGARVPYFHANRFKWPDSLYTYDPGNTLADDYSSLTWPNSLSARATEPQPGFGSYTIGSYNAAVKGGAAGFIGILDLFAGDVNQFLHWYARYDLPALSISSRVGARLREMLRSATDEVHAKIPC